MIDFIGRIVTVMGVKELSRKEGRGKIEKRRSVEFSLSIFIQSFFSFRGAQGTEMERTGKRAQAGGFETLISVDIINNLLLFQVRGVILWTRSAESNCLFTCQHHNGIILSINCAMA